MARHEWEDVSPSTVKEVCKLGWEPRRRCKRCGAVQVRETEHNWMRVVGYRWLPLVGRCKGRK